MSLATNKIKEFIAIYYKGIEGYFLRDAVAYLDARAEAHNQNRSYESLLLDFIDEYKQSS